jgi:ACS family glucarate transporter-like MFS transporter
MPSRSLFVVAAVFVSMLLYVDRVCISSARDEITRDLQLTDLQFGWVISSFTLGYALLQAPMGGLADRFGARVVLTSIVALWSAFTGLTGMVSGWLNLVVIRFLFGAGEAGAYPTLARATYAWVPANERGKVQGIVFCAGRLGGAITLPVLPWLIGRLGWRQTFLLLMGIGFAWAIAWWTWYRDRPLERSDQSPSPPPQEPLQQPAPLSLRQLGGSVNLWLLMGQYFASNFTFFFCLSWLFPHFKQTYNLDAVTAGWYTAAPFIAGALGNVTAGILVDRLYRRGWWAASRRTPAIIGFLLAAAGLVAALSREEPLAAAAWLSVAIFGADMTISPSWATCIDIGGPRAGLVSGTMNMAGNIGSFVTGLAFPSLLSWTGSPDAFFYVAALLNVLAAVLWCAMRPDRPLLVE